MKTLFTTLDLQPTQEEKKLFCLAFTHRSAVNERSQYNEHNERLEFLGDAVLELVSTDYLYRHYDDQEGVLTSLRSALVRGDHLAKVARGLDFGKYLIMSRGEAKSGGANKDYILANTVEAFIGALYLTQGMVKAKRFIKEYILCDLKEIIEREDHVDSKSAFQEFTQGEFGITPHYKVVKESGLDHDKTFVMAAYLGAKKVGEGQGSSKKEAQLQAAGDALEHKKEWIDELSSV